MYLPQITTLTILQSEQPTHYRVLAVLSAVGLMSVNLGGLWLNIFEESSKTKKKLKKIHKLEIQIYAGPRNAVGSTADSRASGSGSDTRSDYILSFLLLLIQERQLSVTDEILCMKYWFTA